MKLKKYISTSPRGTAAVLASNLAISRSYLSQMATGITSISPERAVAIERATNGQVTRFDLRPTDAHLIWPEQAAAHAATNEQEVASHG